MRNLIVAASLCVLLGGCFGGSDPESSPAGSQRAQCDSFAARAIQTADLATATSLAAQASQCYADLQNRR